MHSQLYWCLHLNDWLTTEPGFLPCSWELQGSWIRPHRFLSLKRDWNYAAFLLTMKKLFMIFFSDKIMRICIKVLWIAFIWIQICNLPSISSANTLVSRSWPSITGQMGWPSPAIVKPALIMASRKHFVLCLTRLTRLLLFKTMSNACEQFTCPCFKSFLLGLPVISFLSLGHECEEFLTHCKNDSRAVERNKFYFH